MTSKTNAALCAIAALALCAGAAVRGQAADKASRNATPSAFSADETPVVPSRVTQPVDESRLVMLRGNTHPMARPEFDRGIVDAQMPMERLLLVLKRSPEQEAALEAFAARQLDEKSPDYHHWLTPQQFGRLYGPSDADIAAVTNWLQNRGFTIDKVMNGRVFIEFSGTAGLVQKAFHTEIHHYNVYGEEHIANNIDPSIPEALTPVVEGIFSLNNFFSKPQHIDRGSFRRDKATGKWIPLDSKGSNPLFTVTTSNGTSEMVSPYDFATIYNVAPLWSAGIDGTGVTIAIAGRSTISQSDVATFRSAFGLPAKPFVLVANGAAPGPPSSNGPVSYGDVIENSLDVEWSGAVAKGATIKFVTTASTSSTDGAAESAIYIVDNDVAPIMSFSYGNCELAYGQAGNSGFSMLWQQGSLEHISEFVASGDQGSAACDGGQQAPYEAQYGLAVSGPASTQYNVAVGGTDYQWLDFNGTNEQTTYWNATNASNGSSAKGYIPEIPWNDTCANLLIDAYIGATSQGADQEETCNGVAPGTQNADLDFLLQVVGGTGGVSACTNPTSNTPASCAGGWPKPIWQTGTGVPSGNRSVPDVSLFAASGLLGSMYVICDSDESASGSPCTYSNADDAVMQGVGGTSVASPAMAGIMALIVQHAGGEAQGLPNQKFYQLAAKDNLTACNSNSVVKGNSCIFYDVTYSNNSVPCTVGDTDCTAKHTGDAIGILPGYNAGTGYDRATGLGTVNAYNLVQAWGATPTGGVTLTPSTLAFAATTVKTTSDAQSVTVKNTGTATVTLSKIAVSGPFVQLNTCGASLSASATCTVYVAFDPTASGSASGALTVTDSATGSPQTAKLSGTGAAADSVSLSATSLAFGTVTHGTVSAAKTVTVTNHGTTTLEITGITITGTGAADFTELNTCGPTLAAGANCSIDLAFKPAAAAAYSATLSVSDTGSSSTQKVALTGTGH